jgi:hypothetical protein
MLQRRIAPRAQGLEPRFFGFREALHHALCAGRVAFVAGSSSRVMAGDIQLRVVEPLQGLFHRALDALLEHLSGAIEAHLPADGAACRHRAAGARDACPG